MPNHFPLPQLPRARGTHFAGWNSTGAPQLACTRTAPRRPAAVGREAAADEKGAGRRPEAPQAELPRIGAMPCCGVLRWGRGEVCMGFQGRSEVSNVGAASVLPGVGANITVLLANPRLHQMHASRYMAP